MSSLKVGDESHSESLLTWAVPKPGSVCRQASSGFKGSNREAKYYIVNIVIITVIIIINMIIVVIRQRCHPCFKKLIEWS